MMARRLITPGAVAWLAVLATLTVGQAAISVQIDGRPLTFVGAQPTKLQGSTMVPMRTIFEALGASIEWNPAAQRVTATKGALVITMTIGSRLATVDGRPLTLTVPPALLQGSTMVPLRFVGEALGAEVLWNQATQTVVINSAAGAAPPAPAANEVQGLVESVASSPAAVTVRSGAGTQAYRLAYGAALTRQVAPLPGGDGQPSYAAAKPIALTELVAGDEVTIKTNPAGEATEVATRALVVQMKVRSVAGNRLVFDDPLGTTVAVGPQLAYVNATGQVLAAPDAKAGDAVALFMAPTTRGMNRVSARPEDLAGVSTAPVAVPQPKTELKIAAATHDARGPLRQGTVLTVTATGTPGAKATFDVTEGVVGQALKEDLNRPGTYVGTYTVKPGDSALRRRVTVHLVNGAGEEVIGQTAEPVTIDTTAPRIVGTFPADGTAVDSALPTITVIAEDVGGAGLSGGKVDLTQNGQTITVPLILQPPAAMTGTPQQALNGKVAAKVTIFDAAGNSGAASFAFVVGKLAGAITAVKHSATAAVRPGTPVTVELRGTANGTASCLLLNEQGQPVAPEVPLQQAEAGVYTGNVVPTAALAGLRLQVQGRLLLPGAPVATAVAATPLEVQATAPDAPTVTDPQARTAVASPLTIRGKAAPGALVEVGVKATGTQVVLLVLARDYSEDLGVRQAKADANGDWVTTAIELPRPKDVRNLQYTITVTQTNTAGQKSAPTTVVVSPR